MRPHVIRLRGPWDYRPLARTRLCPDGGTIEVAGPLPPPGQIQMPADWGDSLGADFRGRVRYSRRFGRPTGVQPGQRIDLVVERLDAFGLVLLNGRSLGAVAAGQSGWRADVTHLLAPRNELGVEVELPEEPADSPPLARPGRSGCPGGLIGEVRLEIFS